jgi:LAO/AO transport system kinase
MSKSSGINKNWKPDLQKSRQKDLSYYVDGILASDHSILSESITLLENTTVAESTKLELLHQLSLHKKDAPTSLRVGISGSPGVGKSTFIDQMGSQLLEQGNKIAVLAIDPSSELTKGSILGDKTRMYRLTQHPDAYVRPTPSSSKLGGIAPVTRESILLCEAAGYDTIFIETVGVGQSETHLKDIVDIFCLLLLPGAGDDLQGIKKGIVEISDLFIINKADGDRQKLAKESKRFYENALHLQKASKTGWTKKVLICSGLEGIGLAEVWEKIQDFKKIGIDNGNFASKRNLQNELWIESKKTQITYNQLEALLNRNTLSEEKNMYQSLISYEQRIKRQIAKINIDEVE